MEAGTISFTFFYYGYYIAWFVVNVFAGFWIYQDAKKMPNLFINSKPIWWFFASLVLGGIWVVLAYWAIHHSSISNRVKKTET
jgi:hypothetical protein